jgi:hypothetical protein
VSPVLLDRLLADARQELSQRQPDAAQEAELLQRLQALQVRAPAARRARWAGFGLGGLGLAGAALLASLVWLPPPEASAPGLVALSHAEDWPSDVLLVPTELPRERLAWLGLPTDGSSADAPVRAELVVHPSGRVLAVRLQP